MDARKGTLKLPGGALYVSATSMTHVHASTESGERVMLRGVPYYVSAHLYRASVDAPWTLGQPDADYNSGHTSYQSLSLNRDDYKPASDAALRTMGEDIVAAMNAQRQEDVILAGALYYARLHLESARRKYEEAQDAAREALTARDLAEETLLALEAEAGE